MSVVGDINVTLDAVGLLPVAKPDVVVDALVVNGVAAPAFHVNVLPFAIVAITPVQNYLGLQRPGSSTTVDAFTALPNPEKFVAFVTVASITMCLSV